MPALEPDYLTFRYSCKWVGIPGAEHDPSDFSMDSTVTLQGADWNDEEGDGEDVLRDAFFRIVPDAGTIDLL
ncbi:hypothetical protein [Arthrobacter sp. ISL-65]|uniref:hypothetical protein n=1 Tax=Arthrobacter sp. ISL-65 TaxID=2819112 RepID=UPI001BE6F3FD|nr:hypothetical protein [Arthrobacter sp. ISL-65]MBT2550425.1 hypothetical protein [Arthrobacter sp. ISL-65]